jgi:hypothetical protein
MHEIPLSQSAQLEEGRSGSNESGEDIDMRLVAMMCAGVISLAAITTLAGCTPTPTEAQACPQGRPWVPDDYAHGKWVPGHCLGMPAQ